MRMLTATEASRGFSRLLDLVAAGEVVTIARGNSVIAEVRQPAQHSYGALRASLANTAPPDDHLASDIAGVLTYVTEPEVASWDGA